METIFSRESTSCTVQPTLLTTDNFTLGTRKVVEISNSNLSAFDKYAKRQSIRFLAKIFTSKVKINVTELFV